MGLGGDDQTSYFRSHTRAPGVGVCQEEALQISPAVRTFVIQRFALLLEVGFKCKQCKMDAAVIRRILALGQQAVLLHSGTGVGNFLRVFVGDAFAAFVILLSIFGSPPGAQVAVSVKLASLIIEAVSEFVTYHHSD